VTGVRQDPYANQHRIVPEVDKAPEDKGKYLHPELYGAGENQQIKVEVKPAKVEKLPVVK